MGPSYGNIPGLAVILQSGFPYNIFHIIYTKTTVEFVILLVVTPGPDPPGPIGINITGYGQVKIIIKREIESTVPKIKSAPFFFTIGWQKETRLARTGRREKAKWNAKRKGYVLKNNICRSGYNLVTRYRFRLGKCNVKVWMRRITGGVLSIFHVDMIIRMPLGNGTMKVATLLFSENIRNEPFFCPEIIRKLLALKSFRTFRKFRFPNFNSHTVYGPRANTASFPILNSM